MDNLWDKLKTLKGRSWAEAKDILNKIKDTGNRLEEIVITYKINSETLSEEDREIYGVYPKDEPFYLERCKVCSRLLKPSVLSHHYEIHHKRNPNPTRKTSFISPSKKKHSRKGNKSTSEDDSESVISSETPSPAIDFQDNSSSNLEGSIKEDTIVDIISVEELPSEDSKPPTPGPQDLYEEFAVPYTEEIPTTFSSTLETTDPKAYPNAKPVLKLKISANKDPSQKSQNTPSLLEAHLLSNTKYATNSAHASSELKYKSANYKFNVASFGKSESQGTLKSSEQSSQKVEEDEKPDTWKILNYNQIHSNNAGSPKLKTETKISIPISALPQNVKIIGSFKKANALKATSLLKSSLKPGVISESLENSSATFCNTVPTTITTIEQSVSEISIKPPNEKSYKSKKSKRSKGKNRSAKNVEYDPNKHCGVLIDENRRCLRSLTCKTHLISLRRAVEGRSKEFDKLLAEHRASKELLKEQERNQSYNFSEPIISLPILTADNITGNTIQIPSTSSETEIIKIRVPNVITNPELANIGNSSNSVPQNDNTQQKLENEKPFKRLPKLNAFISKPAPVINKAMSNGSNSDVKSQLYENDVKISFVCSDMLYKVGGLLYMDRSRQAIRKCMDPLISKEAVKNQPKLRHSNRKITEFLQPVKNSSQPLTKLSIFKEDNAENVSETAKNDKIFALENEIKLKASQELERMKTVLANSSKILNSLSLDENKLQRLRNLRKLKRKGGQNTNVIIKKIKQEPVPDENYDISSFLSFDKNIAYKGGMGNEGVDHFSMVPPSKFSFNAIPDGTFQGENVKNLRNEQTQQEGLPSISNMMENISCSVFLNNENNSSGNFNENDTAHLLQTFKELENEICNTVGNNMQNLYNPRSFTATAATAAAGSSNGEGSTAFINYINPNGPSNSAQFKENCDSEFKVIDNNIPSFDENMVKNYSLLEEYCKSIATDELFLDDKTDFEFFENGGGTSGSVPKPSKSNEIIVVNENLFNSEQNPENVSREGNDEGLNFETHILNSYLSSISGETNSQDSSYINFGGRQFDMTQVESQEGQIMVKCNPDNMYEEILTLNKQFQDNTAVKIDQPPTSNSVYTKAENEEVLQWLL